MRTTGFGVTWRSTSGSPRGVTACGSRTWRAGRGTARRCSHARPRRWSGSTRIPTPTSTLGFATEGPTFASSGAWSRTSRAPATPSSSCRRSSTSSMRTRRCAASPPPRRSRTSRRRTGSPWHVREYTLGEYRALLDPGFAEVVVLGLFHARKLRAHELALRLGWDRVHRGLGVTGAFYDRFVPAISASDFALRETDLDRALDFLAICRGSANPAAAEAGASEHQQ